MRALIFVLLVALAVPASAQAPALDSILIGKVRLWLGAPKEFVLGTLREVYNVSHRGTGSDDFFIQPKGNSADASFEGFISFREGRLSSVTRPWNLVGSDPGDGVARAIYGAFTAFGKSAAVCSVSTFDNQEPTTEKKGVAVSCGQRRVEIFTSRTVVGSHSVEFPVVNEILEDQ
jgi:hypothetical protein